MTRPADSDLARDAGIDHIGQAGGDAKKQGVADLSDASDNETTAEDTDGEDDNDFDDDDNGDFGGDDDGSDYA